MAKQMETMYFGQYKGQHISEVPTDYLRWAFGSFPKLRNKLRRVLQERGISTEQLKTLSESTKVLSSQPISDAKRRWRRIRPKKGRRSEEQLRANDIARIMGHDVPYPKNPTPRMWNYFLKKENKQRERDSESVQSMPPASG
jgi:uncharacterized protein (DUF3820 family)